MKTCSNCGQKLEKNEISPRETIATVKCSQCGKIHFVYQLGKEENILETFVEDPKKQIEKAHKFKDNVEKQLSKMVKETEKDLETSMVVGDNLKVRVLAFYKANPKYPGADLVLRSLAKYAFDRQRSLISILKSTLNSYEGVKNEIQGEENKRIVRYMIEQLPETTKGAVEDLVNTGRYGAYYPDDDRIVIERIPKRFTQVVEGPPILYPLLQETAITDYKGVKATLTHENTHAWLNRRVSNYKTTGIANALDEIFAHYISYTITGDMYHKTTSSEYDRPRLISWGVKILDQKVEELKNRGETGNDIDFARKTQAKIYKASTNGKKAEFKTFLRFCLYKKEKRKLQKVRKLMEEEAENLKKAVHFILKDLPTMIEDDKFRKKLIRVRDATKLDDPGSREENLLEGIIETTLANNRKHNLSFLTLDKINEKINEKIEEDIYDIEQMIKAINKLDEVNVPEKSQKIAEEQKKVLENIKEKYIQIENI